MNGLRNRCEQQPPCRGGERSENQRRQDEEGSLATLRMTAKAKAKEPARGTADPSAALGMTTNGEDAKAKEKEPAGSQRDDGKGERAGGRNRRSLGFARDDNQRRRRRGKGKRAGGRNRRSLGCARDDNQRRRRRGKGERAGGRNRRSLGFARDDNQRRRCKGKGKRAGPSCVRINWKPARRRQRQKSRLEAGATRGRSGREILRPSRVLLRCATTDCILRCDRCARRSRF
jgi:hypothetical protein